MRLSPRTRNIIIMAVLFPAAAGFFYWQVTKPLGPTGAPPPAPGTTADAAASTSDAAKADENLAEAETFDEEQVLAALQQEQVFFDFETLRNPMAPVLEPMAGTEEAPEGGSVPPETPSGLALMTRQYTVSGIVWSETSPLAVVDNQVVGAGYSLPSGAEVVEISRDSVLLKQGTETFRVRVHGE